MRDKIGFSRLFMDKIYPGVIGGNVWLTHSVPQNSLVYHKSEIEIKQKSEFPEALNYVI